MVLWIIGRGLDSERPANTAVWSVHVILGFALVAILAWRVGYRLSAERRLPAADRGALQALAKLTHYLLDDLLLAVVVLGAVNAFVRGYNLLDHVSLPQIGDRA